jgi:predicted  nucleic acid-binding Zn-ribbon protein
MDFMIAIATATKALEAVKALREIDKQISEAELKARAADLMSNLADVKMALVEARDEIGSKEKEISHLKAAFQLKEDCVRHENFLYAKDVQARPSGHPYCSRCEQIDGVMIKLTYEEGQRGNAVCPQCKTKYKHVQVFHRPP